jgi:hypothetical protein
MDKMLKHFRVVAERDTGFWITLPVPTGLEISREEWLNLQRKDPDHFQILEIAADAELSAQSPTSGQSIEYALSISWPDEKIH